MRPIHWVLVLVVILVLFGAQKLPELARSLGQSAKILKKEMNDLTKDETTLTAEGTHGSDAPSDTPSQNH